MKTIPLTKGHVALVDDDDFETLSQYRWHAHLNGGNWYAVRRPVVNGRLTFISMQSQLMGLNAGYVIDHIDGNSLNNQRKNLRFCTTADNVRNRKVGVNKQYKGTCLLKNGSYRAMITHNRKKVFLGTYVTEEKAARAYDKAALERFGEFARLNFPVNATH